MGHRGGGEGPKERSSRRIPCQCQWHIPYSHAKHDAKVAETPVRKDGAEKERTQEENNLEGHIPNTGVLIGSSWRPRQSHAKVYILER